MTKTPQNLSALFLSILSLLGLSAHADSIDAACGFSNSKNTPPAKTSACTFSQRQGYISVDIDDGGKFEFSPAGTGPGNYTDADGSLVYRQSGLGEEGQLFKLADGDFLFVYWRPSSWSCDATELATPDNCSLGDGRFRFTIHAGNTSSINTLTITPHNLSIVNEKQQIEIDGTAYKAELADLDADGWPEIYIYIRSAGSGSYGSLAAWAVNRGKSMTPIYLPPLKNPDKDSAGYMGHDEFAIVENRLVRRFPRYLEGDTNAQPTGGQAQLQYRLVAGEAGWQLELDRNVDY